MSQKLQTQSFTMSLKVLPLAVFQSEFNSDLDASSFSVTGVRGIRDYKQCPYEMSTFTQYNFLHQPYFYQISEEILPDNSVITTIPRFIVENGHFYTGDHHNHFIPNYDIVFDTDGKCESILQEFHQILKRRNLWEQQSVDDPLTCDVINFQDRKSILSPQILEDARKKFV